MGTYRNNRNNISEIITVYTRTTKYIVFAENYRYSTIMIPMKVKPNFRNRRR